MDIEKLLYMAEDKLPLKKTLIFGLVVVLAMIVMIDGLVNRFAIFIGIGVRPILYPTFMLSWAGYWIFNKFWLPRNKEGKVGIVIAIYSEDEKERQRLKADFIYKLKKDLRQEGLLDIAEVMFLKNHFACRINESNNPKGELEKINKKIGAHFYVWGDVKKRCDGDKGEKYFISFQGYVIHKPISQNLSDEIAIDFSKVLPREVNFLENRSFKGFETSATIVHLAAKYIIGIAAFVSHDPYLALKLHDGLKDQFNVFKPLPPHLQDIRNRIPKLISDETLWIAKWHFQENRIGDAKQLINRSLAENENNYGTWLFKAVVDFLVDKNPQEALRSVERAKRYAINTFEWRYSEAFLYFWEEKYSKALKICQSIKKQNYINEEITLSEVREFNLNLLKEKVPKVQLYFWVGYLAYFKNKNYNYALSDFEKFEELANNSMDILKQKSSAYLIDIKRTIGY